MRNRNSAASESPSKPSRRGLFVLLAAVVVVGSGLLIATGRHSPTHQTKLLIAPVLSGTDLCAPDPEAPVARSESELAAHCRASGRSAAELVESKLSALGPVESANGKYEIGYTLPVPLLKLLRRADSAWTVDERAIERIALTIKQTRRPVIVYLFSTHFGVNAPIEDYLLQDPENVSVSPLGPLTKDRYYGTDIFPWSLASTDNGITRYRQAVIVRLLDALCRLPAPDRRKIRAATLLGEVHHFHADFERGMGVGGPYVVSDYSAASVRAFREFLEQRFGTIDALNRFSGESFASFSDVGPPAKDIRTQRLRRFAEHIDSFAHGKIPLIGWAFDPANPMQPLWIRIYRNGTQIARVPARFGRQDVLQAKPSFGTADVGWRYDMDFSQLPAGIHRLDFLAERPGEALSRLGSRRIAIVDRNQSTPIELPIADMPEFTQATRFEGHIDQPQDLASYFFNPLVPLWHEFRNEQVVRYLAYFERLVRASCLRDLDLYTHQITPFTNPSWDATKFAVDASLQAAGNLELGVSLYGEATYGSSFFDWLEKSKRRTYGVTEFHPLKEAPLDEVKAMLDRHQKHGARFLSFFLDARPQAVRTESALNIFAIDPDNRNFGSDKLYATIKAAVNE